MNKLAMIRQMLAGQNLSGGVVEMQANFSWLTGGRGFVGLASEGACGSLVVTKDDAIILADNIEAHRLSKEESDNWSFKDFLWSQPEERGKMLKNIAGANFKTDTELSDWFYSKRIILDENEQKDYRLAGKRTAAVLEKTMKNLKPGKTELELAGELAAGMWAQKIEPIVVLIAFDERIFEQRHPLPTEKPLKKYAMGVVCGRYKGLVASATRLVHFGELPDEVEKKVKAAATVDAKVINATRPGETFGGLYKLVCDAYAAAGYPGEERLHHQGGLAGYAPREKLALPNTTDVVAENQAYAWNPSITGAKSEDTILVLSGGNEVVTHTGDWPYIECEGVLRPAALVL